MRRLTLVLLLAAMAHTALAQTDMPEDVETVRPMPNPRVLTAETESGLWLLVQRSGQIAGNRYTLPGKIATLSYQRHLNSFRHPIPRHFSSSGGDASGAAASTGAGGGTGAGAGSSSSR
ncbi:MAG: hypothetical protein H6R26_494 [Proteobacteria bacterium]|nr:hypothetical protein [Pseudomonadota bacterium]